MIKNEYIKTMLFGEEFKSNSSPIKFTCETGETYYVKIAQSVNDFDDLIYECVAVHLAYLFEIPVPSYNYINIIPTSYDINNLKVSSNRCFININPLAFGSLDIKNHEILGPHNDSIFDKHDYNRFINPIDFLKIGIFDFHISNTDRKCPNYNLIFDINYPKGQKKFIAIDHVAIFGGPLLKNRFSPKCNNNLVGNILNCPFGNSIIEYLKQDYGPDILNDTIDSYFQRIDRIPDLIKAFFETIPEQWRYNNQLSDRIIAYLINNERNIYLQSELRNFFKISNHQ
jgi:hypothetical protein